MNYVLTGATGFLGKSLLPLLVERGDVYAVVRPGSQGKLAAVERSLGNLSDRLHIVPGDVTLPMLGVDAGLHTTLRGCQVVHLAGMYDLAADEELCERVNVIGTVNALEFARKVNADRFHHMSSIAVAGNYHGTFTESSFDVGQSFHHPYFSTKFTAERLVRESSLAFRIYRPALVVGSSDTGEADRSDGPYYFFRIVQRLRDALPSWIPLIGLEGGEANIVPVNFVAAAVDHLAHVEGGDGKTFHITDPNALSVGEAINVICKAAHAPEFAIRLDTRLFGLVPKPTAKLVGSLPAVRHSRQVLLEKFGIPDVALTYVTSHAKFTAENTTPLLDAGGIFCPHFPEYAWKLWDYWDRHLDPNIPTVEHLADAIAGKVVVITGASSGIGQAVAERLGAGGATVVLVARSADKLEEVRQIIAGSGGKAAVFPADLADVESCRKVIGDILSEYGKVDILINNAGRSIRRSVEQSLDRFHDFQRTMQLNYFGAIALTMALFPSMKERRKGHIINISSIGVLSNPPRFAAYVASKSALDGFARCFAAEAARDGISVTTIHMPLVRTPMIEPTSIYRQFPTISAEEAADLVVKAVMEKPHDLSTKLGTVAQLTQTLLPSVHHLIMGSAYGIFPDSAGKEEETADGKKPRKKPELSLEAYALSELMRGVHL